MSHTQPGSPSTGEGRVVAALALGAATWCRRAYSEQAELLSRCVRSLEATSEDLVAASVRAKWGQDDEGLRAEEWASGPLPVARLLALLRVRWRALASGLVPQPVPLRAPFVPPAAGQRAFAALPALGVHDRLVFAGHHAEVHGQDLPAVEPPRRGGVAVVLGAGNVVSTPLLDVLHQVFLEGRAALWKPSPAHTPLLPLFRRVLAPLVEQDLCAVHPGDGAAGAVLARAPGVAAVHLTGSVETWRALRADPALAGRDLTAEVGCCAPAFVVPGRWRARELRHVAAQLAAYVATNGGATCLAPRLLVTCRGWPQRGELLALLRAALAARPPRPALHPGVAAAYARAAGLLRAPEVLPPVLRSDLDAGRDAALFEAEHFAPVLLELPIEGDSVDAFVTAAEAFVRERVYGALTASWFAPPAVLRSARVAIAAAIARSPHASVVVNGWSGLAFGLGSSPWGVPADANVEHGRGLTRGTAGVVSPRRTVVLAPFRPRPLPPWLPAHRRGLATLRALTALHASPTLPRLAAVAFQAWRSP